MATKKKSKKGTKAFIAIILVLLTIFLSGVVVVNHYLNKINRVGDVVPIPSDQEDFETDV